AAPPPAIPVTTATAAKAGPDPARALALVEQGRAVQKEKGEGGAPDAIVLYRQAIEADPKCTVAYWELGWSYQVTGEYAKCVETWERLRAIDPRYPELDLHYPIAVMRRDQAAKLAALPDPGQLPPPEETPREGPSLRLAAVG